MFINQKWQMQQLDFLRNKYSNKNLHFLLKENKLGNPLISVKQYNTSANMIHHLNHLTMFAETMDYNFLEAKNIIEWGGGYGNMAKLLLRINSGLTLTLIDLPIFSFIQAVYLSCIYGTQKINLILDSNNKIIKNKINIIPINKDLLTTIKHPIYDIFVSTWALSESNLFSQEFVERINYFNSNYLLIGYQSTSYSMPYAERFIKNLTLFNLIYNKKIPYIGGKNYYLFAKKIN